MSERRLSGYLAVCGVLTLCILPFLGMILAYFEPPGLLSLPPMPLDRVSPLLVRSLALAGCVSALSLSMGTWLAWVEVRTSSRVDRFLTKCTVLTLAVPSYVLATLFREHMAPEGIAGQLLGSQGQFTGFGPAVLTLSIACTPYAQILVSSALRRCPASEEESARALGVYGPRLFWLIIAPRLRPTWAFSLALVSLYVISDFGAVAVLDCEVLTWELYKARGGPDAIKLGFGLAIIAAPLLWGVRKLHGSESSTRAANLSQKGHSLIRPLYFSTSQRLVTWTLAIMVAGGGVFMPLITLTQWTYLGWVHEVRFAPVLSPALSTLWFAGVGALLVLIATLTPAWFAARGSARRAQWIENTVYAASSIPGVLIAVGLFRLFLGIKRLSASGGGDLLAWWAVMERSGSLLFIGYITRFMSQAYAGLKPSMLNVSEAQLQSARLLGGSKLTIMRSVIGPAITPGVTAAYLLLFVSIAKELPMTLMLSPLGYTTLSYRIFDAQNEGALPDIGLTGLCLLVMVLGAQLGLNRWRDHG